MQYAIVKLNEGTKRIMTIEEIELLNQYNEGASCTVVEELKFITDVRIEEMSTFSINQTYSDDSKKYYIKAPYTASMLDAVIAYIQFVASDIDEHYGMYEEDIIKVLSNFYDCIPLESTEDTVTDINLYMNWKSWASEYNDIIDKEPFYRTGLVTFLEENIFTETEG